MSERRNHLGKTILAIIPFGLILVVGWFAEKLAHAAIRLDFACWRAVERIERWAAIKGPEDRA